MNAPNDRQLASISTRIGKILANSQRSMTTAESCTGGFVAKLLTDIAGSSAWFSEAFVTYSNAAKISRLGVSVTMLQRHGAVSEVTARAMCRGALRAAKADVAVAVTGVAGPGGGSITKPVGTVCFGWAVRRGRAVEIHTSRKRFRGDRDAVRRKSVREALLGALRFIQ